MDSDIGYYEAMDRVRKIWPQAEVEHARNGANTYFVITKYRSGCDWVLASGDTIYNAWRNAAKALQEAK